MSCVTRVPWFSTFFRFFFWSLFLLLPGGFQASFGTFFASISSSTIFLISYLFLRPMFNWFLLIFGRMFQWKLCRVYLTFATWSTFKNLDFAWKVLQKWRFGMPGWIPKSIKNRIQIWMKKTLGKSSKNQPKINQKCTKHSLKKWSTNQYICGSVFNRK